MSEVKTGEIIKNEAGRPSLYRVEMCDKVVEYMSEGKTDAQTCALLGISPDSLARYRRQHPEMAEAYQRGKILQQAHWESVGMGLVTGDIRGNATTYIFMMSNLFPQAYKQKNDSVQVNINSKGDVSMLTDDELQDRLKQLSHLTENQ